MLIQKTFHLPTLREAAQARLANLPDYRQQLVQVDLAALTPEGRAHFVFRLPWGFRAEVELVEVPGGNPAQTLFRSVGGNMEVLGVLEYFQIRPGLTEIVLTLDYNINSWFHRLMDQWGHGFDRFLNRQLECLEAALDGPRSAEPVNHHPPGFSAIHGENRGPRA